MMRLYVAQSVPHWFDPSAPAAATKLGVSRNPKRRRGNLNRRLCEPTRLIWQSVFHQQLTAYQIEAALKRQFAPHVVRGTEWFSLPPETIIEAARALIREAAERAGISKRTLARHLGPRGTPAFGAALNKRRQK